MAFGLHRQGRGMADGFFVVDDEYFHSSSSLAPARALCMPMAGRKKANCTGTHAHDVN
jgi:hypothetical protein